MKHISIVLLLSLIVQIGATQTAHAQKTNLSEKFAYPNINKTGNSLDDFSPKNWEITDTISGDLNKDGIDDYALILAYKDSIKIKDGYKYPRILLLVFKVGDQYVLKLQHNTLLEYELIDESGNTGSWNGIPFQDMEIINRVLKLHFKSDVRGVLSYTQYIVRYQSNDFYLIGATFESGYRASSSKSDYNFSTKRYTYDAVDIESGFGGTDSETHKKGKLLANSLKKFIDFDGELPNIL